MKKTYKILIVILIIIASPFIILFAINYGLIIKEYFLGNKYVLYWEKHPENFESIKHNETFTFKVFSQTLKSI